MVRLPPPIQLCYVQIIEPVFKSAVDPPFFSPLDDTPLEPLAQLRQIDVRLVHHSPGGVLKLGGDPHMTTEFKLIPQGRG